MKMQFLPQKSGYWVVLLQATKQAQGKPTSHFIPFIMSLYMCELRLKCDDKCSLWVNIIGHLKLGLASHLGNDTFQVSISLLGNSCSKPILSGRSCSILLISSGQMQGCCQGYNQVGLTKVLNGRSFQTRGTSKLYRFKFIAFIFFLSQAL